MTQPQDIETHEPADPLDLERAMVFLECHGSQSSITGRWEQWAYSETDYCPEWLTLDALSATSSEFIDRTTCVTVLDFSLTTEPEAPKGYRKVYQYAAGEHSCPWCGDGSGEESKRSECKLCEGDGLLYWGEECQVVVFAPIAIEETLTRLRTLLASRDNEGALTESEGREFFRLFESLDGALSLPWEKRPELPKDWHDD